jgi:hypothetical protein
VTPSTTVSGGRVGIGCGVGAGPLEKPMPPSARAKFVMMLVAIGSPVYPGDVLRTEIWQDGAVVSFRTTVPARDNVVVINNGRADVVAGA